VRYLQHRVADAGQRIGPDWFEDLAVWVSAALDDPDAKVLVHCHMGVNRAPSAVLALLLSQGVGLRPALDAIRKVRPVAVIDYARSALDWHLARTGADARMRRNAPSAVPRAAAAAGSSGSAPTIRRRWPASSPSPGTWRSGCPWTPTPTTSASSTRCCS
jgi:hypothetical protein